MSLKDVPPKNVALVGETGVGKSTLVNVLAGSIRAEVTNDVKPCTAQLDSYVIEVEGIECTLWETRGWNGASEQEATGPLQRFLRLLRVLPDADHELRKFLCGKNPKIDLVLFCLDAQKLRVDAQWMKYGKVYAKSCRKKIKVAVVVTRMDWDTRKTDWRSTCRSMANKVLGEPLDARIIEAVQAFDRLQDTRDCRSEILKLIFDFS